MITADVIVAKEHQWGNGPHWSFYEIVNLSDKVSKFGSAKRLIWREVVDRG